METVMEITKAKYRNTVVGAAMTLKTIVATIDGIEVLIERKDAGGSFADTEILILNGDGSAGVGSTNRSAGAAWPTSYTTATFGSSSDSWGETWTPAKINSSNFSFFSLSNFIDQINSILIEFYIFWFNKR